MSRLFALITQDVVDVSFVILNPDATEKVVAQLREGIGVGWYEKDVLHSVKLVGSDPKGVWRLAETIHSKIVLFHARRKTVGEAEAINTHPFTYKNYMFIHGGTLRDWKKLEQALKPQWKEKIKGETDSERLFYFLLQNAEGDLKQGLKKAVEEVKKLTSYDYLNFILSDGKSLYAYSSGERSLYYWKGKVEEELCCTSVTENIAVRSRGLVGKTAVVVAGQKFQMEGWKGFKGFLQVTPDLGIELF